MKIKDLLPHKKCNGMFGIEVEVESEDGFGHFNSNVWTAVHDGSLRDGCEFITVGAIPYDKVKTALIELKEYLAPNKIVFSFRTSIHVHVNILDMSLEELTTFIYLYYLFEEPLMTFCGEERKGNRFCLSLQDSEGVVNNIEKLFKNNAETLKKCCGSEYMRQTLINETKYAALNLASIPKFGSLEFRGMRGTLDLDVLSKWFKMLYNLREAAVKFQTMSKVYDFLFKEGPKALASEVFHAYCLKEFSEGYEDQSLYNASLMIMLPHTIQFEEDKPLCDLKKKEAELKNVRFRGDIPRENAEEQMRRLQREREDLFRLEQILAGQPFVHAFANPILPPAPRPQRAPKPIKVRMEEGEFGGAVNWEELLRGNVQIIDDIEGDR